MNSAPVFIKAAIAIQLFKFCRPDVASQLDHAKSDFVSCQ